MSETIGIQKRLREFFPDISVRLVVSATRKKYRYRELRGGRQLGFRWGFGPLPGKIAISDKTIVFLPDVGRLLKVLALIGISITSILLVLSNYYQTFVVAALSSAIAFATIFVVSAVLFKKGYGIWHCRREDVKVLNANKKELVLKNMHLWISNTPTQGLVWFKIKDRFESLRSELSRRV